MWKHPAVQRVLPGAAAQGKLQAAEGTVRVVREHETEEGTVDQVLGDIGYTSIGNRDPFILLLVQTFGVRKSVVCFWLT